MQLRRLNSKQGSGKGYPIELAARNGDAATVPAIQPSWRERALRIDNAVSMPQFLQFRRQQPSKFRQEYSTRWLCIGGTMLGLQAQALGHACDTAGARGLRPSLRSVRPFQSRQQQTIRIDRCRLTCRAQQTASPATATPPGQAYACCEVHDCCSTRRLAAHASVLLSIQGW